MILSRILQKPNKTHLQSALIRDYVMKSGLTNVKRVRVRINSASFAAWFSLLICIKNDHIIQDKGAENVYIYIHSYINVLLL